MLTDLSHSSAETLHLCPRKYELNKLIPREAAVGSPFEELEGVDFAYGKAVHAGMQSLFIDQNFDKAIWEAFKAWSIGLDEVKKQKSFWTALQAIDKGQTLVKGLLAQGWIIAQLQHKPAVEVSFTISMPDGFRYRGHIDLILFHPERGTYMVVEIKTTGFNNIHEAMYGNSQQGLGYGVVIDRLCGAQASITILYLVYKVGSAREWETLPLPKSKTHKAMWFKSILNDKREIEAMRASNYYPMRSQGCYAFFRPCNYYGLCTLQNSRIIPPGVQPKKDTTKYDFTFDFLELLASQLDINEY